MIYNPTFFFARCCLGKVPGGAPFSQSTQRWQNRKDRPNHANLQQKHSNKLAAATNSYCRGREDETDARAVRPNSFGEMHRMRGCRVQNSARGSIEAAEVHRDMK